MKVGFGVAEDVQLMIDANGYDTVAAVQLGRRVEALDIGWLRSRWRQRIRRATRSRAAS
jgi:hypothetical protein